MTLAVAYHEAKFNSNSPNPFPLSLTTIVGPWFELVAVYRLLCFNVQVEEKWNPGKCFRGVRHQGRSRLSRSKLMAIAMGAAL